MLNQTNTLSMNLNVAECTTCSIIKNQKRIIEQQQKIIDALTEQNRRLLKEKSRQELCISLN